MLVLAGCGASDEANTPAAAECQVTYHAGDGEVSVAYACTLA